MKAHFLIAIGLLHSTSALAQTTEEWDGGYGLLAQRRSGFTIGAELALGVGNAEGYPNDAVKLNDARYHADTKFGVGPLGRVWLGGTIRDWFSFGLGIETLQLSGNGLTASASAFLLRPELYPLWSLGGPYRDLGVSANFGLGWAKIRDGSDVVADGGSLGVVGIGVFHETLRSRHFGVGPMVGGTFYFSETLHATILQLGIRAAFTAGP